jgi:acetyltransferase-like isoleucine patch superfamily enzyme
LKIVTFYFRVILGLPKSLIINLKYFGFKGLKLPIIVVWRTRLSSIRGEIILKRSFSFGMIRIGFSGVALSTFKQWNTLNIFGTIIFEGTADFGTGSKIYVGKRGILSVGNNFLVTANAEIICVHKINFGKNILLSWDILIMDSDSHPVKNKEMEIINKDKPIIFEDNLWIGARSIILKGAHISSNSVVAAGCTINKKFDISNVIIAGFPARIVKREINWLYEQF